MTGVALGQLGLPREQTSRIPSERVDKLAATLDRRVDGFPTPFALPLLWHWAFFTPSIGTADLAADGHPPRTDRMAIEVPRRMWVGGSVHANGVLLTNRPATRRTRLCTRRQSTAK